jgi:predicted membrane protein
MPLISIILVLLALVALAKLIDAKVPALDGLKTLLSIVLALIAVGVLLWAINTYIPMAESIKAILNIVVVIASCVWVLKAVGLWDWTVRLWNKFWYGLKRRRTEPPLVGAGLPESGSQRAKQSAATSVPHS